MRTLRDLMETHVRDGRVAWIGVRPARRAALLGLDAVEIGPDGLEGDHAAPGKRAVTLIQAEHLPVIAALCGGAVTPQALRRNLLVSGINLAALRGRQVRVGGAVLKIEGACAPCSRMEEALGPGGYAAVRHHGGWCASVAAPGRVALGDAVAPC